MISNDSQNGSTPPRSSAEDGVEPLTGRGTCESESSRSPRISQGARVLLVVHDVYQEDNQFPLGPAYLASVLRDAGAFVEVYCMDVFHYSNDDLAEKLRTEEYDLIGLGFLAARFVETIIGLCKTINANKRRAWLVLGGHGPSPIPEYVLETTQADVVAIGEAETTIVQVLRCRVEGTSLDSVPSIAFRRGSETVRTPQGRPVKDLDAIPFPAWDLFPMDRYTRSVEVFGQKPGERSLVFASGRGCTNRCSFCYRLEKGLRLRSVPRVVEEIRILGERYGVSAFFIQDETFLVTKKRIFQFEEELQKSGLKITFSCDARVDVIDQESLACLKRMGCRFLNFGLESSSDHVLNLMHKRANVAQNTMAVEAVRSIGGIGIGLNFLWCNPGDTETTLRDNVDFIKRYNGYHQLRTIRPVTPYPGSDLYRTAIETGLLRGPDDFFRRFVNSDLITVNFTEIPDERCYELLLEANTDLILDHYAHTTGDLAAARSLIKQFEDLYSGKVTNFRGARHYEAGSNE